MAVGGSSDSSSLGFVRYPIGLPFKSIVWSANAELGLDDRRRERRGHWRGAAARAFSGGDPRCLDFDFRRETSLMKDAMVREERNLVRPPML